MALLPVFPQGRLVNKDGEMTEQWKMFFSQLHVELRKTINQEGMLMPVQSGANVLKLNTAQSISNLLYDNDSQTMKVNNYGIYQTIARGSDMTTDQINALTPAQLAGQWIHDTVANKLYFGTAAGTKLEIAYT